MQNNKEPSSDSSTSKTYNYKEYSIGKIERFFANDGGYIESDSFKIYPLGTRKNFTGEYFVT